MSSACVDLWTAETQRPGDSRYVSRSCSRCGLAAGESRAAVRGSAGVGYGFQLSSVAVARRVGERRLGSSGAGGSRERARRPERSEGAVEAPPNRKGSKRSDTMLMQDM